MPIPNHDYTDALIVLEKAISTLKRDLPDRKYERCAEASDDIYRANLALDLYLRGQLGAEENGAPPSEEIMGR